MAEAARFGVIVSDPKFIGIVLDMAKSNKPSRDLARRLAATRTPIFVIDADRKLAAFNSGCEALTGWTADEVVGETCLYGSVPESTAAHALAASLCPPVEVFSGTPLYVPARIVARSGDAVSQQIQFLPLRNDREEITGVIGVILPPESRPIPPVFELPARLHADLTALRSRLRSRFGAQSLVARSPAMARVLAQVELAQFSPAFVLLHGEPGTGREHLAKVIHFGGASQAHWFVPLDCRRLGTDELSRIIHRLLERHAPSRHGPEPQPGTVFLSDVDALPRELQSRIAESYAPHSRPRLRLIASTSADLAAQAAADSFRADFFALISTLTIDVPPLRDRGDDRRLLAVSFLEDVNRQGKKQLNGFSDDVWPRFDRYHWPGNLDELASVVREAHRTAADTLIRPADLPFRFRDALQAQDAPPPSESPSWNLDDLLTRVETRLITLALERAKNNKSQAAESLGINRARLLRRMEQLGLGDVPPTEAPKE